MRDYGELVRARGHHEATSSRVVGVKRYVAPTTWSELESAMPLPVPGNPGMDTEGSRGAGNEDSSIPCPLWDANMQMSLLMYGCRMTLLMY